MMPTTLTAARTTAERLRPFTRLQSGATTLGAAERPASGCNVAFTTARSAIDRGKDREPRANNAFVPPKSTLITANYRTDRRTAASGGARALGGPIGGAHAAERGSPPQGGCVCGVCG